MATAILLCLCLQSFASDDLPDFFLELLDRANMTFEMPEGFVAAEVVENPERVVNHPSIIMFDEFVVKHPEKRLEIRYTIRPFDQMLHDYREGNSSLNPNTLHSASFVAMVFNTSGISSQEDTRPLIEGIRQLPQAEKRRVNADWGVATFISPSRQRFGQDFFKYCVMVAIHKAYLADVYFFFLGDNQDDVVELARNAFSSLRFNVDADDVE